MKDITHLIDKPKEMPICPLCNCVIVKGEVSQTITAHGVQGIVHTFCLRYGEHCLEEEEVVSIDKELNRICNIRSKRVLSKIDKVEDKLSLKDQYYIDQEKTFE